MKKRHIVTRKTITTGLRARATSDQLAPSIVVAKVRNPKPAVGCGPVLRPTRAVTLRTLERKICLAQSVTRTEKRPKDRHPAIGMAGIESRREWRRLLTNGFA